MLTILAAFPLTAGISGAQQTSTFQIPDATSMAPAYRRGPHDDDDPSTLLLKEKRAKELNILRQKQLTSDAAKLLALATELNTKLDAKSEKSREESTTVDLIRKTEQIEKLARSVRTKMTDAASN